jgi:hypothetical protein
MVVPLRDVSLPEPSHRDTAQAALRRSNAHITPVRRGSSIPVLIMALFCFVVTGFQCLQSCQILSTHKRASGTVVDRKLVQNGRRASWMGTIAFTADDGQPYYAQTIANFRRVGDRLDVLYLHDNPAVNYPDTVEALWGFPIAFTLLGSLLLLAWMVGVGTRPRVTTITGYLSPGGAGIRA